MKRKLKTIIISMLFITFITTLIICIYKIVNWKLNSNHTINKINEIQNIVNVEEIVDNEKTEIIEIVDIPKSNPYWDYIRMNLINVDFTELKNINKDTVGWIKVNGTNINYPFVQTSNNTFYLNHSYDKKYNDAGWVFLDYRNNINTLDKNNIIYAHGRLDNTMFGSLKNILKNEWLNNTNNYIIKLSTITENTLWQVFSIYHIPTTNDYIKVNFNDNESFIEFGNMLLERSIHDFNTTINENDIFLTLSTCYNDEEKMVMHAKLIKKEIRQ
jgi:sortase B